MPQHSQPITRERRRAEKEHIVKKPTLRGVIWLPAAVPRRCRIACKQLLDEPFNELWTDTDMGVHSTARSAFHSHE